MNTNTAGYIQGLGASCFQFRDNKGIHHVVEIKVFDQKMDENGRIIQQTVDVFDRIKNWNTDDFLNNHGFLRDMVAIHLEKVRGYKPKDIYIASYSVATDSQNIPYNLESDAHGWSAQWWRTNSTDSMEPLQGEPLVIWDFQLDEFIEDPVGFQERQQEKAQEPDDDLYNLYFAPGGTSVRSGVSIGSPLPPSPNTYFGVASVDSSESWRSSHMSEKEKRKYRGFVRDQR